MNNSFALKASSAPLDTAGEPRTQGKSKGFRVADSSMRIFQGSIRVRFVVL